MIDELACLYVRGHVYLRSNSAMSVFNYFFDSKFSMKISTKCREKSMI